MESKIKDKKKIIETDKKKELVARREKILNLIQSSNEKNGYPPTVREILEKLEIKSVSTVHCDLKILEKEGYISRNPAKPRALKIKKGKKASSPKFVQNEEPSINIPILGQIAAGSPITASENFDGFLPVPERYARGESFMLKVKGDSMIEKGIFDGDFVMIRKQAVANNGEIIAALITDFESEATVKTFFKEKNQIILKPENPNMESIIIEDFESIKILGIVTGVFRFFS